MTAIVANYEENVRLKPEKLLYAQYLLTYPLHTTHAGTLWPLIIASFLTTSLSQSTQTAGIKGGCRMPYIRWFLVSVWNGWFRLTQCPGSQNPIKTTNHRPPAATIPSVIKGHVSSLLLSCFYSTPNVWYGVGLIILSDIRISPYNNKTLDCLCFFLTNQDSWVSVLCGWVSISWPNLLQSGQECYS